MTSPRIPIKFSEHDFFRSFKILVRAFLSAWAEIGKRVQIPRCRATVSEEIGRRSLGNLGRPAAEVGRADVLTRKPGDRREPPHQQPLSRDKEDCMRSFVPLFLFAVSSCVCVRCRSQNQSRRSAIRPRLPGRRSRCFAGDDSTPARRRKPLPPKASLRFAGSPMARYRVQVLAPGFARGPRDVTLPQPLRLFTVQPRPSPAIRNRGRHRHAHACSRAGRRRERVDARAADNWKPCSRSRPMTPCVFFPAPS